VISQIRESNLKRTLFVQVPAFIGVRTVINTMVRMVYPFLPIFGRGLEVDLRMLTLAITFRSASGVLGPLLASVGDSYGRKTGMLFGISLFTAGAFIMVIWPSYPAFVLSLVLGIMANFVFIPSMQAFLGDRVPYERRGMVLGLSELGWSLSFILGVPLAGLVIDRHGWRAPFPWLTGLGLLAMLVIWLILPGDRPTAAVRPALMKNLGLVITFWPAISGILFALALSASNELVNLTFGTWLEQIFQVKIAALAVASAIIGISELSSEVMVTGLVDWLGKRRAVVIGLAVNGVAALALPFLGRSLTGALAGLFFIYLSFEFTLVSSLPLMTEVVPAARATFMSTYIAAMAVGRAAGALIVPIAYNLDAPGANQMGILPVMLVALSLDAIAFFALRSVKTAPAAEGEPAIA
jgi:MFS transporter, DHA1 family, inner membrane transport protein